MTNASKYALIGFLNALYVIIPILRIWVTRNRRYTLPGIISELFFWISWIVGFTEATIIIWSLVMFGRYIKQSSPIMAAGQSNLTEAAGQFNLTEMAGQLNLTEMAGQFNLTEMAGEFNLTEMVEKIKNSTTMKIYYGTAMMYILYLWSLKGAFIALYWTLFPAKYLERAPRLLFYGVVGFIVSSFIVNMCIAAFWCRPIHSSWSGGLDSCNTQFYVGPTVTLFTTHLVSDLMVLILPLSVVASLKLRRREALALVSIFGVGLLSIVASTIRFVVIYRGILDHRNAILGMQYLSQWTVVEYCTAMIAFCAPAFRGWLSARYNSTRASQDRNPPGNVPRTIGTGPSGKGNNQRGRGRVLDSVLHTYVTAGSQIELTETGVDVEAMYTVQGREEEEGVAGAWKTSDEWTQEPTPNTVPREAQKNHDNTVA